MNPKSTLIKDAIKCLTSAVGFACTTDEVQTIIATNLNGLKELSDEHPTLKLGVSVVSKLVNNLAPGWFEKGFSGITYKNLKAALNSQHPNDLNHDLVKLIRLASVEALRLVEKMYLDNLKKSDNNEDPKKVGQVFDRLVAKLKFVCENENEKVNNHTLNEHEEWRTHFTDYIFQETGVDPTSQFALEIKQNLPFCLDLAIKEALKDSKNERAFKSYQIWVLESIVENSRSTEVGIGNIQKELKALKEVWQTQNQITGNGSALASQIEAEIEYLKKGYNQILDAIINFEMLIDKRLEKTEITIIKEVENAKDEIIRHVNNSKGRKVNPILSSLPFNEIFEGRTQELQEVEILLTTYKTLNVISIHGIGGVGKSTLAKQLFLKLYDNYDFNLFLTGKDNFAMTFYENTLITNLGLNDTVNAIPSEDSRRVEKIAQLIVNELLNLPGEKLMLLDNIPYNMGGLQPLLNRGWHIISTSRNLNYGFKHYELQQASPEDAKLIYAVYFGLKYESLNACELVLIQTIVKRLSFHILAIELVAKNAKYLGWNLEKTVEQLDKNGLNIARYADIQTTHSQEVIKNIFTYILQIFPLENLDAKEQHLLLLYSLIPATNINAEEWALMLGDYAETWQHFSRQLHQKGWLSADDGNGFLLHALLAEVLRIKNENKFFEEAQTMINRLNDGLNDEKWHNNFQESVLFARIGLVLIGNINKAEYKFGILSHNLGKFYIETGNLLLAMRAFTRMQEVFTLLLNSAPHDSDFKNGLAISYSKLGETHSSLGNLDKALEFFEERNKLGKELYALQPNNVSFKNGKDILLKTR
ncbi:MAG: hypothetical protein IPI65_07255 [Bacteroidetes bacterium]|nr:hypothetical protein [Bacteroidota bacterium]